MDTANFFDPHTSFSGDSASEAKHDLWELVDRVCERHGIPVGLADSSTGYEHDGD